MSVVSLVKTNEKGVPNFLKLPIPYSPPFSVYKLAKLKVKSLLPNGSIV